MRKTIVNLANVVGGEMLLRIANFAALVLIARLYGPAALGLYAGALAVTTIAVMLADNGLQTSAITEIGRAPDRLRHTISCLMLAKTLLMVPAVIVLIAVGASAGMQEPDLWFISALVAVRVLLQSYCQLQLAVLKSLDRMRSIGRIQAVHFVFLLVAIGLTWQQAWSFAILLLALVCGQLVELALSAVALWKSSVRLQIVAIRDCLSLLRRSTPVGFTHALANIIVRLDVLVLSVIVGPAELGEFAAAHALLVLAYVVSWLFGSVVLPEMMRMVETPEHLLAYLGRWSRWLFVLTAPVAIFAYWVAPAALKVLYGDRFDSSGEIAAILLLAMPLILLNSLHVNHAIAHGWVSLFLGAHVATMVLAIALNFALGLSFSAQGVAAAVLARELFLFFLLKVCGRRLTLQLA